MLDAQGVPALARIVAISATPCPASLTLTTSTTYASACTGTVRFEATNPVDCGTDYRWWLNGQPMLAASNQAYFDCPASNTSPTAEVRVEVSYACGGAAVAGARLTASHTSTVYFRACNSEPNYRPAPAR